MFLQRFAHKNLLFSTAWFLAGCASHLSYIKLPQDENKDFAFAYCQGQQWGYAQPVQANPSVWQSVVVQYNKTKDQYFLSASYNLEIRGNIQIEFPKQSSSSMISGASAEASSLYWLKQDLHPYPKKYQTSDFTADYSTEKNGYLIYKKKYGGFFGQIFVEKPILYQTPAPINQPLKENLLDISNFDSDTMDAFYVIKVELIPIKSLDQDLNFSFKTPDIVIGGKKYEGKVFKFSTLPNKVIEDSKKTYRCASLSEVFWHRRRFSF